MTVLDVATGALLVLGAFFFLAGTLGVLRFPDTLARVHAVTKADNLGLGLLVVALVFQADSALEALKLLSIWLLVLVASANAGILIARAVAAAESEDEGAG